MEQTEEELLEYARLNYPIGTRYIPAHVNIGINEVNSTFYNVSTTHIHVNSIRIQSDWDECIYERGKWATIISKPEVSKELKDYNEEERLAYAKKHYPIGTKYHSLSSNGDNNWGEGVIKNTPSAGYSNNAIAGGYGYIYSGKTNTWAEIIKDTEEEKTQYIVGKWYTSKNWFPGSCCKFIGIDNNGDFEYSERIYDGEYEKDIDIWSIANNIVEAPLELVQPFLPEGHKDKITVKEESIKKDSDGRVLKVFIPGKWYCRKGDISDIRRVKSVNVKQGYNYYNYIHFDLLIKNGVEIGDSKVIANSDIDQDLEEFDISTLVKTEIYRALPFPNEPYVRLRVIKELPFLPKGSITWTLTFNYTYEYIHVESNRWRINYSPDAFEIIEDVIPNIQSVTEEVKSRTIKYGDGFTVGEKVMYEDSIHTIEGFTNKFVLISGPKGIHGGYKDTNTIANEYGEVITYRLNSEKDKYYVEYKELSKLTTKDKIGELQNSLDKQSEFKKPIYNEGDYIVCNEDVGIWIKKGEIAILGGECWDSEEVNKHGYLKAITVDAPLGNGCSRKVDFRHATKEEIEAYKNGIRNISDINQSSSISLPSRKDNIKAYNTLTEESLTAFLSDFFPNKEVQLIKPKEDKRFNTSVNKIESVKIQLKQKSKTIKF